MALSLDSSTPIDTPSATVDLQQHGPYSDYQERIAKGDNTQLSVEPATERLTGQEEPQEQIDPSTAGADARLADLSSPLIATPTQTENLNTTIVNDDSQERAVDAVEPLEARAETRYQTDRPAHEIDAVLHRPSSAPASRPAGSPVAIEDDSEQRTTKLNQDFDELGAEVESRRVLTEKRRRIYQIADTIIEALNNLSEVHDIARAASIAMSGIYRVGYVIFGRSSMSN
ncbi:hypothetical protein VNI00_015002 [Paramarasmius palmivorus]|uniref:Uncharacterized protein n=1 Tax=Paramarasmius palmivorus TaxID=297713 RepID=A0AAW0BN90_9AGAR